MEILSIIYLAYMFIAIYLLCFTIMLFFNNRRKLFDYPKTDKFPSVSFIIPAWNEGKTIRNTIEAIFEIDYPNILEVIVAENGSTDDTKEVVKELQKKYSKLILVSSKKCLGNAARGKNFGLKYAKGELVAFVDADSYPAKDSLKKMVGFLEDEKVGAATCSVLLRDPKNFPERLQDVEYRVIVLARKLLEFVGAVYVTPGPLALYKKKVLDEVGGYDGDNMVEDVELAWHLLDKGWEIKMCLPAYSTTTAPNKFKKWYKQRLRWAIGGVQCIAKYKKSFMKKGIFGMFIIPFFIIQFFLGIIGLGIFAYLFVMKILVEYLFVKSSISAGVSLLTINNFYITPSFLNYLGAVLFIISLIFTLITLSLMKKVIFKKQNFLDLIFYSVFYLAIYPVIALHSVYKYFKGGYTWR